MKVYTAAKIGGSTRTPGARLCFKCFVRTFIRSFSHCNVVVDPACNRPDRSLSRVLLLSCGIARARGLPAADNSDNDHWVDRLAQTATQTRTLPDCGKRVSFPQCGTRCDLSSESRVAPLLECSSIPHYRFEILGR